LAWVILLAALLVPRDCWAARIDGSSCTPAGFVTADNDIRLDNDRRPAGKPIALPTAVSNKVRAIMVKTLAGDPELGDGLTCDALEESVYRVAGVGRPDLYVASVALPVGPSFFFLLLYDPASGALTESPPRIGSKWPQLFGAQDPLVRIPLVSQTDLFHDGHHQIVFEERVHNGTVYNAVIYHYFDIGPQLKLTRILARETRVLGLIDGNIEYTREFRPLSGDQLRLELYETTPKRNKHPKLLGYSILKRAGPECVFQVSERHPAPGVAANAALVTDCDSSGSDDIVLRDGCDFYY
jgi:hypothetical protein